MVSDSGLICAFVGLALYAAYCRWKGRTILFPHVLLVFIAAFLVGDHIARDAVPLGTVNQFMRDHHGHLALVAHEGNKTITADLSSNEIESTFGYAGLGIALILLYAFHKVWNLLQEDPAHDPPHPPAGQTPAVPPAQPPAAPVLSPAQPQQPLARPQPQQQPQQATPKRGRRN